MRIKGKIVKELRKAILISPTPQEVADHIGLKVTTYYNIETHETHKVSDKKVKLLAEYLGLTQDQIETIVVTNGEELEIKIQEIKRIIEILDNESDRCPVIAKQSIDSFKEKIKKLRLQQRNLKSI